ncbi:MAG: hypothetical protein CVV42_16730 [Candidatus Riflebacteria bacterium HGW-Riflebacteria-2]|jgi:hypothetical protein|nr:MAG: hypothetical protein CVV42_16730 [Candidatus Riflebacteria bacterium HGW-Riflebacteria-2]
MTHRKAASSLLNALTLILLLSLVLLAETSSAQFFNEPAEPEIPVIDSSAQEVASQSAEGLPEPLRGEGKLSISIESFKGGNPKRISRLADRVEIWLGDHRLASLNHADPEVVREKNRRIFLFPELHLTNGYYFITVRLYSTATLYGRDKWHGETFQVGIHPGRTARVYRKVAFFHF